MIQKIMDFSLPDRFQKNEQVHCLASGLHKVILHSISIDDTFKASHTDAVQKEPAPLVQSDNAKR